MPSLLTFLLAPSDGRPVERAACVVAWSFVALLTAALFTFAFNQLHYGWTWPKQGGDSANILCPSVGDPNTGIPETKAFMVNVRKA